MLVAQGWNVDYSARSGLDQALVLLFGVWKVFLVGWNVLGTLLGV